MAIKKSDLYSSLWASCDELRGGMDASQYKDYVLFMLFIKYISDKYGNSEDFAPPVTIPKGASFGEYTGSSEVQGRRKAPHLRLRGRQSAFFRQDLEHRSHSVEGSLSALRLG